MMSWTQLSVWLVLLVILKGSLGDDQEYRLIRYLMSNYDPAVRPSLSAAQPVTVAFRLSLLALLSLDEKRGVLTSSCRITQKWNDVHLRWNASDFGGVATVRIPAAQIWRPDVLLRNNADPSTPASAAEAQVVLRSSGDVSWSTQSLLRSACPLDLSLFPFDTHLCHLNFTSWSYDAQQVSLSAEPADLSHLQPHPEFHLEEVTVAAEGGPAFSLSLRRRPGPHLLGGALPCFLAACLSALGFAVPPASAERVTLAVGCLLAVLVVVLAGGSRINPSVHMPLLGLYQVCSLCLVSSAAFLSALTLGLHAKGADGVAPPPWLRSFVLGCLARILCLQPMCPKGTGAKKGALQRFQEADEEDRRRGKRRAAPGNGDGTGTGTGPPIERYSSSPQLLRRRSGGGGGGGTERSSDEFERRFLRVLDRVHETLERNEARDLEMEGREAARREWKKIAQVTDRLLLILFLFGALLSAAMLFVFAPL